MAERAAWQGAVLLDWSRATVLHHPTGCLLCCTVRAGTPPRHPDRCLSCGYGMPTRPPVPDPCQFCGKTAHVTGPGGRPVHKVCAERALAEGRA